MRYRTFPLFRTDGRLRLAISIGVIGALLIAPLSHVQAGPANLYWKENGLRVDSSRSWTSIASSSDGTKLVAVALNRHIYTSSDSGATWTPNDNLGKKEWVSVASSSDGTKLAAATAGGYIYTSSDSGATWTERTGMGVHDWRAMSSSSDGTNLVLGGDNTYVYTSSDSGATWTERTAVGTHNWTSFAAAADGSKVIGSAKGGE